MIFGDKWIVELKGYDFVSVGYDLEGFDIYYYYEDGFGNFIKVVCDGMFLDGSDSYIEKYSYI